MDGAQEEVAVDAQTLKLAIRNLIENRARLEQATSIAKAAEAFALCGNLEKGIELALEIEQITFQVNASLNASRLIRPAWR